MNIATSQEDRKEKIKRLREFHQKTLDDIGESGAVFIPKMAYKPTGKTEKYIGFFANEIDKGENVFVEFCSKELNPEDPERTLYKWIFNPHFEEYEKTGGPTATRFLIPTAELIIVKGYPLEENKEGLSIKIDLPDPDLDLPLDQITIRDLAAIMLRSPVSRKTWLNQIIKGE